MEFDKKTIVDIDGSIEHGKQFDLELKLPEDNRNVVYGLVKDNYGLPVCDAGVKLVEVCDDDRKPVSHTFTDKEGEFVFGPLCPGKKYAIQIWKDDVKHIKVCAKCHHEGKCLKGIKLDCDFNDDCKEDYKDDYEDKENCKDKDDYKPDYMK